MDKIAADPHQNLCLGCKRLVGFEPGPTSIGLCTSEGSQGCEPLSWTKLHPSFWGLRKSVALPLLPRPWSESAGTRKGLESMYHTRYLIGRMRLRAQGHLKPIGAEWSSHQVWGGEVEGGLSPSE